MAKNNRSIQEFHDNVSNNFISRRDELHYCKGLLERNRNSINGAYHARYLLVVLYSHWEGFIKYSSECLLQFIYHLELKNRELNTGLLAICHLQKLNDYINSKIILKIQALETILTTYEQKAQIPYDYSISTYSKLNTETLEEICLITGIDETDYILKKGIIDEKLVSNRNKIAHGELIRISPDESIEIYELMIPIFEKYKTDILNKAIEFHNLKTKR